MCVFLYSAHVQGPSVLYYQSVFHPFLLSYYIPLHEYTTFGLSIHQLIGHFGCFYLFIIINNAIMNINLHVLGRLTFSFLLVIRLMSGIPESYGLIV